MMLELPLTVCFTLTMPKPPLLPTTMRRQFNTTKRLLSLLVLFERQQGTCFFCRERLILIDVNDGDVMFQIEAYDVKIVIHHIVELSRGGQNVLGNLALVHEQCHHQHSHKQSAIRKNKVRCNWDISHWRL